jgi:hypothetical protein
VSKKTYVSAETGKALAVYERSYTGRMLKCPGEAHSNIFIDHCGVCLGYGWGKLPEYAPVDMNEAWEKGLTVMADAAPDEFCKSVDTKKWSIETVDVHSRDGDIVMICMGYVPRK